MSVSIEEQETCVNFSRNDSRARIYTSDSTIITKLNKLIKLPGTEWKLESVSKLRSGEIVGRTYSCPVKFISFRKKHVERAYSVEERNNIARRLNNVF